MTHRAYIGLGANLGDASAAVASALDALACVGAVLARSSLYRTAPWGKTDQPDFVNAVALVETTLSPRELLGRLKALEVELGREPSERWGPRAIDLDLLTYGDVTIEEEGLQIPHSGLRERAFVLVPLAEIDASYATLRDALAPSELAGVKPMGGS